MEFSGKSCIRQNFGFSGSLLEIPGTPGGVLIFRDFPGKNGRVGQYGVFPHQLLYGMEDGELVSVDAMPAVAASGGGS